MSVIIQPFQFLKFTRFLNNQLRFQEGFNNDLCDVPVIPKGKFIPFGIISGSNVIGDVNLVCHSGQVLYYNVEMSQSFTKNNCLGDEQGESIQYIVPASKYSGGSQAEANAKATADIEANGQNYANQYGECLPFFFDDFEGGPIDTFNPSGWAYTGYAQEGGHSMYADGHLGNSRYTISSDSIDPYFIAAQNYTSQSIFTANRRYFKVTIDIESITTYQFVYNGQTKTGSCLQLSIVTIDGAIFHYLTQYGLHQGINEFIVDLRNPIYDDFVKLSLEFGNFGPNTQTNQSVTINLIKCEAIPLPQLYGNAELAFPWEKNDCESGTGSEVIYTVPANTYFAESQYLADDQAINDQQANGQNYANENGTCS